MPLSDMSSPPLRIELRPSRLLRAVLLLLAALAALALLRSAAPLWTLLAVPPLLAFAWPRASRHGWNALVLRSDGSAAALHADGSELALEPWGLQRRGWLTVLSLVADGSVHSHLFTPETMSAELRRRLVLWFARHVDRETRSGAAAHV
jgi:hypothetical protein